MAADFVKNLDKAMDYLHRKAAFLTVKSEDKVNPMTISWGSVGYEWGKPMVTVLVRHSRFTHDIIEKSGEFTVSIPIKEDFKKALSICGSKSGRDVNKLELANLTTVDGRKINTPVIAGCDMYYECRIVYKHEMSAALLSEDILKTSYADGDFHTIYYGEIVDCYQGE